jgi:hypothetical protein
MTYISIDTTSTQGKKLVELIKTMPFAKILREPNDTTRKAMTAAKENKTRKHTNSKELIAFLNK